MHTNNAPALRFYRANAQRTGSAIRIELHPAHDSVDGFVSLSFVNQSQEVGFPGFDWADPITVKLDFVEVCKVIQVLRGECESIDDGKGIFIRSPHCMTVFSFRHMVEPVPGYEFNVKRRDLDAGADKSARFVLNGAEALGLCCAFEQVLGVLAFGNFNG